jgi:hypothetical protein
MCVISLLLASCANEDHDYTTPLKAMLGDDYESAKILGSIEGRYVVTMDLSTLEVTVLGEYPPIGRSDGLSRPRWTPDGSKVMFSYGTKAHLMNEDGSEKRVILNSIEKVYAPSFWVDPDTDELCIVYKDISYKNDLTRGIAGGTYLARLRSAETEKLFDIPCDGGLSRDGTHLGEAYRYAAIIELATEMVHQPYKKQTCNSTISPDNTYRLMFLRLPHTHFAVWNKYGQELWSLKCPEGSEEWGAPQWSSDPDICISTVKYGDGYRLAVIRLSTKEIIVLRDAPGNWNTAAIWLKSASERKEPGASETVTDEKAMAMLKKAMELKDAEQAAAIYKEIKARASESPAAEQAARILVSGEFKAELSAAPLLKELWTLTSRLAPVVKSDATFSDAAYFKRNRSVLIFMTRVAAEIIKNHPGTGACAQAEGLVKTYGLPGSTDLELSETVVVEAVVDAISRVPTAAQIAPYRDVITYVRYKVDRVIKGDYREDMLVAVHWGMKDAKHTAAATRKPGRKLRLTLDRFDSHPRLWRVTTASGADDEGLTPYWALKEEEL